MLFCIALIKRTLLYRLSIYSWSSRILIMLFGLLSPHFFMRSHIQNLRTWIKKNHHWLMPASLVLGFVGDSLTLRRVAGLFENVMMIVYLVVTMLSILAVNYLRQKENRSIFLEKVYLFAPFVIQFTFGGLFSGFTVFYFRSGSLASSWIFIVILLALMLGNEIYKKHYEHLVFQVTTLFTALYFYLIFAVPVLVNKMGAGIFLLSGVVSLVLIAGCIYLFVRIIPKQIHEHKKLFAIAIGGMFVFINILYLTNMIPPVPLALKVGDAYYQVTKVGGGYQVTDDTRSHFLKNKTLYISPSDSVYVFSSVFAPTKIDTRITHRWQYYDTIQKKWTTENVVIFSISGGREQGYRGYSFKTSTKQGKWRVRVETSRGQIIGTIRFNIQYSSEPQEMEEKML